MSTNHRPEQAPSPAPIVCEHCGQVLSRLVKGLVKLSVPSRLVAFDPGQGGVAEMACPGCGRDTRLPVRFFLRLDDVSA